jgi:hypothetical protein
MRAELEGATLSCASGIAPDLVGTLQALLPATPLLRSSAVTRMAAAPGKGCVVNLDAVLDYFDVRHSAVVYIAILMLYLGVMHVLTYGALLLLAKKERR